MAHIRTSDYSGDSHDGYASSSSSHRHPDYSHTNGRGRPAYTTVRPFIINSIDDHHRPVRRERDDHDEHHRRVGDYVADRLVPTMLRSSDRPVEVFMNFGDANLALPNLDHRSEHGRRVPSKGPNAIIYNAPGCSLTIDGRRCDRYCDRCDLVDRDHHDRERHHHNSRELVHDLDSRHHSSHPRSHSHVRIVSHSRNPSPSPDPLPLPGLFPIATAVEKASHSTRGGRSHGNRISHAHCPGCLIKTTVYRDGYRADCDPPRYSTSSSRRADVLPMSSGGTRVQYIRETDGSASDDSWARVEVASRDIDRNRRRDRGRDRERVYDVITDGGGYGGLRRGRSRWEKERRSMPRYSGYTSESDL